MEPAVVPFADPTKTACQRSFSGRLRTGSASRCQPQLAGAAHAGVVQAVSTTVRGRGISHRGRGYRSSVTSGGRGAHRAAVVATAAGAAAAATAIAAVAAGVAARLLAVEQAGEQAAVPLLLA